MRYPSRYARERCVCQTSQSRKENDMTDKAPRFVILGQWWKDGNFSTTALNETLENAPNTGIAIARNGWGVFRLILMDLDTPAPSNGEVFDGEDCARPDFKAELQRVYYTKPRGGTNAPTPRR